MIIGKQCCKVLLVDDDESDYVLVREWLALAETPSFNLLWADGFDSALKMLDEAPDAILVDYDLGGYSGLDLLREINQRGYSGPTIMLTGRGGRDVDQEALRLGVTEYLAKNETTPRLLERTLRYAIEHKRVEDELRRANAALARARDQLEERVLERTAELQRKQEELAYQAYLLENVSDAIVASDASFKLTAWNRAAEQIYGWSAEEVLGRVGAEVLKAEMIGSDHAAAIQRLRETGALSGEFYETTKDGRRIIVENKTIALADASGRSAGFVAVNRDITERKAQENLIHAYTARMEALAQLSQDLALAGRNLEAILDAVTHRTTDLIGDVCTLALLADDGQRLSSLKIYHPDPEVVGLARRLFGSSEYLAGVDPAGLAASRDYPISLKKADLARLTSNVRPELQEFMQRFPIYALMLVPLHTQAGEIGTLSVARYSAGDDYNDDDLLFLIQIAERTSLAIENARLFNRAEAELSERRQAEAALRASRALFERLFESTPNPTLLLESDACIRQVNRQTLQVFGYSLEELSGRDFGSLLTTPHQAVFREFIER